jgi:hypothetical protein
MWTSLIGPAVVAAVISGVVAAIGIWISARTTRSIHTEKLEFDREQAERRINAEIGLAEKKVDLDRAFAAWKRKAEFAEEVLSDFYQARDVINGARSPGSFGGEGTTRQKGDWESESDTGTLNAYFATTERLVNQREFFAQLHARRYRFMTYFGNEASKPYADLHRIYAEIVVSVRMLIQTHQQRAYGTLPENRQQWQAVIRDVGDDDAVRGRLDRLVEAVEATCGPTIREISH